MSNIKTIDIPLETGNQNHDDSDSELEEVQQQQQPAATTEEQIDTSQLQWFPWMWYYAKQSAKKTYEVCDTAGEKLAWFFGITKPKYYAEIQEYERMDEEEREAWRQAFQDIDQTNQVIDSIVIVPPEPTANIFTISTNQTESSGNI